MTLRLFVPAPLAAGVEFALPAGAARHAMVRRVQPGDDLVLFDGSGHDWPARVLALTRSSVNVRVGAALPVDKELAIDVTLAVVVPANERMDVLVEKATELGASRIQPLHSERSVLRLGGEQAERAERKRAHWQGVAQAACEQCGRSVVPRVEPVRQLPDWLRSLPPGNQSERHGETPVSARWLLSLQPGARGVSAQAWPGQGPGQARAQAQAQGQVHAQAQSQGLGLITLSGPEGGFTADEEALALEAGFVAIDLGPRVLRAETAPLTVLAWLALRA